MKARITFDQTSPGSIKVLWNSKGQSYHIADILDRQFKRRAIPGNPINDSHWLSQVQGNAAIKALRCDLIGPKAV